MMTMKKLEQKLQKADRKQSVLYLFCNFVSLMLISAYSAMMFSPTIQNVFPEGGDSRKQMIAIFILALFGCVVFTIYAASLFFRKKSRQLGTLMALGASRKRLAPGLFHEVFTLSSISSLLGIVMGFPFVWGLWTLFRLFLINSEEMALHFDFKCLFVSALFFLLVVACSCLTAYRYLRRTNILDIIHEEHKNEPVRQLGTWCGPVGVLLLLLVAMFGYGSGSVYMTLFSAYPPAWLNITYTPVFIGLYMIMLHTVSHGWRLHKKNPYKNIVSRSMMKFQGRQTVNNLLVSTVLIAGACFGIFYIPMLGTGQILETNNRPYDYAFHFRTDQNVPTFDEINLLAEKYKLTLKDKTDGEYLLLGLDGNTQIDDANNAFHYEYRPLLQQGKFLSEDTFYHMTGQKEDIQPGTYLAVSNTDETGTYFLNTEATKLTNMVTRQTLDTTFAGFAHYDFLTDQTGYYILDNTDYNQISTELTPEWKGNLLWFNTNGNDSYEFADELFLTFVNSFDSTCEQPSYYDPIEKIAANERGEIYWGDTDAFTKISYSNPDSTDFRSYWTYMPKIRILDKNDFLQNFAVFLMMFLFIAIVCILAALIISYTRCQTIALNNRYIFEDLKRLGASPAFLTKELKNQCGIVFKVPTVVGMTTMYLLYTMLMYANDGKFTASEFWGLAVCLGILILLLALIYFIYTKTVHTIQKQFGMEQ